MASFIPARTPPVPSNSNIKKRSTDKTRLPESQIHDNRKRAGQITQNGKKPSYQKATRFSSSRVTVPNEAQNSKKQFPEPSGSKVLAAQKTGPPVYTDSVSSQDHKLAIKQTSPTSRTPNTPQTLRWTSNDEEINYQRGETFKRKAEVQSEQRKQQLVSMMELLLEVIEKIIIEEYESKNSKISDIGQRGTPPRGATADLAAQDHDHTGSPESTITDELDHSPIDGSYSIEGEGFITDNDKGIPICTSNVREKSKSRYFQIIKPLVKIYELMEEFADEPDGEVQTSREPFNHGRKIANGSFPSDQYSKFSGKDHQLIDVGKDPPPVLRRKLSVKKENHASPSSPIWK